jgi:spermidine synthase
MKIFEIDPLVIEFARRYFTYLRDARGRVEVVTGDARLSLEREMSLEQNLNTYDVIAVDAFSGDAVPVHLLTREMFEIYDRALRPDGILALHVSNRYLDLRPVVQGAVVERGMKLVQVVTSDNVMTRAIASTWLLATRNETFVAALAETGEPSPTAPRTLVWTDDFSSLLSVLR